MTAPRLPRPVVLSDRVYRALLRIYPRRFRLEYRTEMARVFRDSCRQAYDERNSFGLLPVWGIALLDLVKNVPEEAVAQLLDHPEPAAVGSRCCSGCNSEVDPTWRTCKICGTFLLKSTTHEPPLRGDLSATERLDCTVRWPQL